MMSYSIKELLEKQPVGDSVEVNGWVKTFRSNRFIALNDGSTIHNLQCVVDFENLDEKKFFGGRKKIFNIFFSNRSKKTFSQS